MNKICEDAYQEFHEVPMYVVIVLLIIFLVATVIISCLAIHLCARRIQKQRLLRALGRSEYRFRVSINSKFELARTIRSENID